MNWRYRARADALGSKRIQVNVLQEFQEVSVNVHQQLVMSVFEQMPGGGHYRLHRAGIARTDPLHEYTNPSICYLYQQMEGLVM